MLLDLKNCFGQISWQGNGLNVNFDLSVAKDGSIKLTLNDIPFNKDVLWLQEVSHKRQRYFEFLELKGQDAEGNAITSNSLIFNSLRPRTDESGDWPWTDRWICFWTMRKIQKNAGLIRI
jgi:hypothetical protein